MIDSIIFDLDGTLWDATEAICMTWNMVLDEYKGIREPITTKELEGCMGLLLDDISRRLFPDESPEMQKILIDRCCDLEVEYLSQNGGKLYEGLEDVLKYLSKKYKLFIVSNCQKGYIESFFEGHGLQKYFIDVESAGNTGMEKGENNKLVINRNGLKAPVYVGDTEGDRVSANVAKIPFVYAAYGFGNPEKWDYKIEDIRDLKSVF